MNTIILEPVSQLAERLIAKFGNEWLVINDRQTHLIVTDLDDRTKRLIYKKHDDHFAISVGKADEISSP